jgi:DNA-binding LacI/PurR family transcriptional regulator
MNKENITIKDIARELGISPSTVSRALKDHPDISQATRDAVNDLAKKWNYKPNPIALSLKSGSSRTIGVIIPDIVHFFFSTIISGIEDIAYERGYNVMMCQSNEKWEHEVKNVQALVSARVDGILISVAKETTNFDHFRAVADKGLPLVFFDRIVEELDSDRVIVDDEVGAYNAVNHLLRMGKKRIMHLSGPLNLPIARLRIDGFKRALKEYRITPLPNDIIKCDTSEEATELLPKIFRGNPRPDAIFAVNDLTAVQALIIAKQMGLKVPEDVAIVGFTNSQIATLTEPGLTSVDQRGYEIGLEAAKLLLARIEDPERKPQTKIISTELVVRGSSSLNYNR